MEFDVKPSYQGVSFIEAIKLYFKNYANFSGRSSRSEYWWVYLAEQIVFMPLYMFSNVLQVLIENDQNAGVAILGVIVGLISAVLGLALLIPGLSLGCRRLHDIGKSGWWQLLAFIPCIGGIILLIWTIKESDPGENEYGDTVEG